MDSGEDTTQTPDGLTICYQWLRNPDPKGVILIVHGVGEHIGRYRELEGWFCENGFTCYGYDQRGHGLSTGRRTHVNGFSEYVADLHQITAEVQKREAGLPIYIYAHSMGTIVALLGVLSQPTFYQGLIITSPAVAMGSAIPGWQVKAGSVVAKVIPTMRVPSQIDPASLSHDSMVVAKYVNDALVEGTVTLGWLSSLLAAQKEVLQAAAEGLSQCWSCTAGLIR